MSRRTKRAAARKPAPDPRRRERPVGDAAPDPRRNHPRLNKWFLGVVILLETAWIGLLISMALPG